MVWSNADLPALSPVCRTIQRNRGWLRTILKQRRTTNLNSTDVQWQCATLKQQIRTRVHTRARVSHTSILGLRCIKWRLYVANGRYRANITPRKAALWQRTRPSHTRTLPSGTPTLLRPGP